MAIKPGWTGGGERGAKFKSSSGQGDVTILYVFPQKPNGERRSSKDVLRQQRTRPIPVNDLPTPLNVASCS